MFTRIKESLIQSIKIGIINRVPFFVCHLINVVQITISSCLLRIHLSCREDSPRPKLTKSSFIFSKVLCTRSTVPLFPVSNFVNNWRTIARSNGEPSYQLLKRLKNVLTEPCTCNCGRFYVISDVTIDVIRVTTSCRCIVGSPLCKTTAFIVW